MSKKGTGTMAGNMQNTKTAAKNAEEPQKKRRKRLHEYSAEDDMKYKAPLNYQSFQILGWLCIVLSVIVLVIRIGGKLEPSISESYGGLGSILGYFAELSLPFLLIANFSRILSNSEGYRKQMLRNGGAAVAIFIVAVAVGSRYVIGTLQLMVVQKEEVVPILTEAFRTVNGNGFIAFNLFIDLFLCTLTMFFLNAKPKSVFTGRLIILFRLFTLLPIAYEVACFILKVKAASGEITLPLWSFPLLTVKPPVSFLLFVFLAFLVKFREYRYCRHGKTHEDYLEFMKTNRNSFHMSVHLGISLFVFALIDFILLVAMMVMKAYVVPDGSSEEVLNEAMMQGIQIATAVGIGDSFVLALVAPLMLLYSYNAQPKQKIISMIVPAVGIVLIIVILLEAVRMVTGIYMADKLIDLNEVLAVLQTQ